MTAAAPARTLVLLVRIGVLAVLLFVFALVVTRPAAPAATPASVVVVTPAADGAASRA